MTQPMTKVVNYFLLFDERRKMSDLYMYISNVLQFLIIEKQRVSSLHISNIYQNAFVQPTKNNIWLIAGLDQIFRKFQTVFVVLTSTSFQQNQWLTF